MTVAQVRAIEVAAYHRGLMAVDAARACVLAGTPRCHVRSVSCRRCGTADVLRGHLAIRRGRRSSDAGSGNGRVSEVVR